MEKKINELMQQLYISTYKQYVMLDCAIDSNMFQNYLKMDIRFQYLFLSYKASNNIDISLNEFIDKHLNDINFFDFVRDMLLDMPNEIKPDKLYVDEIYPFKFEYISRSFTMPSFEDFSIEIGSEFLMTVNKLFYDLNEDEINRRKITFLENKIDEAEDRIEKRIENEPKRKRILKYDSTGLLDRIYNSRQACCDVEGISKGTLSNHLSGRRKQIKGYTYKELEW